MSKDIYFSSSLDLPKIKKKRSYFDLTHSSHTSMNVGLLYPLDKPLDVIPGDSIKISHKIQLRMTNPPKTPTMDQLVFDLFFFYVPNRIVWSHWDQFITGDTGNDYTILSSMTEPALYMAYKSANTWNFEHSVLDYIGFNALKNSVISDTNYVAMCSLLPLRGYYKIWNEYFRYTSLQDPVFIDEDNDNDIYPSSVISAGYNYYTDPFNDTKYNACLSNTLCSLTLMRVNRLPDYFSRCLPEPQAGPEVKILNEMSLLTPEFSVSGGSEPLMGSPKFDGSSKSLLDNSQDPITSIFGDVSSVDNSIRSLSQAFALNKLLWLDNVYGRRITEWTYGHFGVSVPDDRVQRPEFLTKKRIYVNINQIMQSSQTATTPQGNAGAWSVTFDAGYDFTKSFVEFGYIFTLGCIRVMNHTYAQGIDKSFTRRTRFDYFMPEFVNTGDEMVFKREIYYNGAIDWDKGWAFQERYASYKYVPSRVTGFMRPQATNTLAVWSYTDYYATEPYFSNDWLKEPIGNVDRTLYIAHTTAPQFILDAVWDIDAYRPMPYHSIPGGLTGGF